MTVMMIFNLIQSISFEFQKSCASYCMFFQYLLATEYCQIFDIMLTSENIVDQSRGTKSGEATPRTKILTQGLGTRPHC